MRERRHRPRLAFEAGPVGARREHLDRDAALELVVVCEPDGAHRAAAERLEHPVAPADRLPCHLRGIIVIQVSDLLRIDEALALVLARVRPLPLEDVALAAQRAGASARTARAAIDLPPFAELRDGRLRACAPPTPRPR